VAQANKEGQRVIAYLHSDAAEFQGVNNRVELCMAEKALMKEEIAKLIEGGVHVEDPETLYIDSQVKVEGGARLGPNVTLRGNTQVKQGAVIEGSAYLLDTVIEEDAVVKFSVRTEGTVIGKGASVGPFANLRPGTVLGDEVKIGNFVETKKANLARGAKASHLTYLGDVKVGENSNIGAGTITCNYDGVKKHETVIGKDVFIGSDSCLVAPVTIEDGSYVGAGSVITKRVPKDSLALTRAELVVKEGWAKRKRKA